MNEKEAIAKMRRVVEALPPKPKKEVAPEAVTEEIEGEGIPEVTPKRPKVEVGNKLYVPENKSNIEITKDYGKGTPKEDYPGMYRMDMSGWVEVTDLETGDKFPITRNDLVELGIEGREAKPKSEKEKVEVTPEKKEPWEVTKDEFVRDKELKTIAEIKKKQEKYKKTLKNKSTADYYARQKYPYTPSILVELQERERKHHKKIIQQALKEGKTIPQEVLKDYPDLNLEKPTGKAKEPAIDVIFAMKDFPKLTKLLPKFKSGEEFSKINEAASRWGKAPSSFSVHEIDLMNDLLRNDVDSINFVKLGKMAGKDFKDKFGKDFFEFWQQRYKAEKAIFKPVIKQITGEKIEKPTGIKAPEGKAFATKATKPQETITRADLKSIFAKMKNISTGVDKDGNFFFRPFGKPVVTIYEVNEIEGYIDTSKGQIPVGSFLGNKMELKTGGEGHTADIGTAFHEFEHWMEANGILSNNDIKALDAALEKQGLTPNTETRAEYVGDRLSEWQGQKNLRIRRVLKKIADFVNSIWEFVTRTRTARGVLADIESGKILTEKEEAFAGINRFAPDKMFQTTEGKSYNHYAKRNCQASIFSEQGYKLQNRQWFSLYY
jgi:hypothetical protein